MSGRSSACCSTTRTARSHSDGGSTGCAAVSRVPEDTARKPIYYSDADGPGGAESLRRSILTRMSVERAGRERWTATSCTLESRPSVQIEVPRRLRDRFLLRLLERFFEPLRQRVAAVRSAATDCWNSASRRAPVRRGSDARRSAPDVAAHRLLMPDDAAEVGVDHQRRLAARTGRFEFGFEFMAVLLS